MFSKNNMDNYNNPEEREIIEFEGERLMGVGRRETKEPYLEDLENLKQSYRRILQFKNQKSKRSDLENQLHQIITFFCQCVTLEKAVIASKRVQKSSISSFMTTRIPAFPKDINEDLLNICRTVCVIADNHVREYRILLKMLGFTTKRTTREDELQKMQQRGIRDTDVYYKELDTLFNECGGTIDISILGGSKPIFLNGHEIIWDNENPFRQVEYGINLGGRKLGLFKVLEMCANCWVKFLKIHALIPEEYSFKSLREQEAEQAHLSMIAEVKRPINTVLPFPVEWHVVSSSDKLVMFLIYSKKDLIPYKPQLQSALDPFSEILDFSATRMKILRKYMERSEK